MQKIEHVGRDAYRVAENDHVLGSDRVLEPDLASNTEGLPVN